MTSLTADNVTLTYLDGSERITALDSVNLRVDGGRIAAITGPSGSGKSSLPAVTSTLLRPDSGRVLLAASRRHPASGPPRTSPAGPGRRQRCVPRRGRPAHPGTTS